MRYLIIETVDEPNVCAGVDITLGEYTTLFEAECALNRFLYLGHDAYLVEVQS